MVMKAVFGLGNPGDRYALTRHNVGARAVLAYVQGHKPPPPAREEGFSIVYRLSDHLCVLPQTYMNRSGIAYVDALDQFGIKPADSLVVFDDADLPFGQLRVRQSGGAGGQKGMASILAHMGHQQIPRMRIGIGGELRPSDLSGFVLEPFSVQEQERLPRVLNTARQAIECFLLYGVQAAMNRFNGLAA